MPAGGRTEVRRWIAAGAALGVVAVTVYPVAAYTSVTRRVQSAERDAAAGDLAGAARSGDTSGWTLLHNSQPAAFVVSTAADAVVARNPLPFGRPSLDRAMDRSAGLATVDSATAVNRFWVLYGEGRTSEALADAAAVYHRYDTYDPGVVASYGELLARSGQPAQAQQVMLAGVRRFAFSTYWAPGDVIDLGAALRAVAGPDADSTACAWHLLVQAFPSYTAAVQPLAARPPAGPCSR